MCQISGTWKLCIRVSLYESGEIRKINLIRLDDFRENKITKHISEPAIVIKLINVVFYRLFNYVIKYFIIIKLKLYMLNVKFVRLKSFSYHLIILWTCFISAVGEYEQDIDRIFSISKMKLAYQKPEKSRNNACFGRFRNRYYVTDNIYIVISVFLALLNIFVDYRHYWYYFTGIDTYSTLATYSSLGAVVFYHWFFGKKNCFILQLENIYSIN